MDANQSVIWSGIFVHISLPLHSFTRIEPIFTDCLIKIHYLTIFMLLITLHKCNWKVFDRGYKQASFTPTIKLIHVGNQEWNKE